MASCYVCAQPFDATTVLDHGEHVIQNALGGGLIAEGILCSTCGTRLGGSVDDGIFNALQAIAVLFDLRRDRGGLIKAPARVSFDASYEMRPPAMTFLFDYEEGPRPTAPTMLLDRQRMQLHLFAAKREQIRDFPRSATFKKALAEGFTYVAGSRLEEMAESITLDLDPNALAILRGTLKIAIGYALHNGIDRTSIAHFIVNDRDITANETLLRDSVQQYHPVGWVEALYEAKRYDTDDFPPNHQLVLFSEGTDLYCYVDLFGVIQKYVHLSDCYKGEAIVRRYAQRCPKWAFTPADWMVRRVKDLMLLASEFEVDVGGKSLEELHKEVMQRASTRPYELAPAAQLGKLQHLVSGLATTPQHLWTSHDAMKRIHDRALIAQSEFGSDYLWTLTTAKAKVLIFSLQWDVNQFRISGNDGSCPKGAAARPPVLLEQYQQGRVETFAARYGGPRNVVINTLP